VKRSGRMARDKGSLPAAEARNVQDASMAAERIPKPPELMGREA
jgi:hypothetical protein